MDEAKRGFTPENVFEALMTIKEATEMGFARVDRQFVDLSTRVSAELSAMEGRLNGRIERIDNRLAAIEGEHLSARLTDHEIRISRLEGRR